MSSVGLSFSAPTTDPIADWLATASLAELRELVAALEARRG